jgi:hypothetical protein
MLSLNVEITHLLFCTAKGLSCTLSRRAGFGGFDPPRRRASGAIHANASPAPKAPAHQ